MYCINAALNLVKLLTVENQENTSIYELVHKLFSILEKEDWYKNYISNKQTILKKDNSTTASDFLFDAFK